MFTKEAVNGGRQSFADIAKTILIFIMAQLHLIAYTPSVAAAYPQLNFFVNWFSGGVFGAPVFMFCMGTAMAFLLTALLKLLRLPDVALL